MNRIAIGAGALLLLSPVVAGAGALDRGGQPVGILFEDGNYAELSFSYSSPDLRGTFLSPLTGTLANSGDVGSDFASATLSFKSDLSERFSLAVIVDHPFGAEVDYSDLSTGYPVAGSRADVQALAVTALGRYKLNDRVSVHAGARFIQVEADLLANVTIFDPVSGGAVLYGYDGDFEDDSDLGYVVGAAYERPELGLRVALTYSSETQFSHETSFSGTGIGQGGLTEYSLPRSVNLDFQTGLAADTRLFGSVRWVDWSETVIDAFGYAFNPVVSYEDDYVTYTLGVGRRFNERFGASAAVIYEPGTASDFDPATGQGGVSNLSPTDGQAGIQLAASYALNDRVELGAGVRYVRFEKVTTRFVGAEFDGNDALSARLGVGVRF